MSSILASHPGRCLSARTPLAVKFDARFGQAGGHDGVVGVNVAVPGHALNQHDLGFAVDARLARSDHFHEPAAQHPGHTGRHGGAVVRELSRLVSPSPSKSLLEFGADQGFGSHYRAGDERQLVLAQIGVYAKVHGAFPVGGGRGLALGQGGLDDFYEQDIANPFGPGVGESMVAPSGS